MSIRDPYLINVNLDTHLRDARHAHRLFTEHSMALAPKTKYLYHVVFQPFAAVGDATTSNAVKFQKEVGVLCKSIDLPQYNVSVENKQQYNRKKNLQTRIDYRDITIRFHDDNNGLTRAMLIDYYNYHFRDGIADPNTGSFNPRDKYKGGDVPRYGLDNDKKDPFFAYIKIYHLARRNWFSYTLINPILTQWGGDTLESSDGSGMAENSMTIAYESVLHDHGVIGEQGEPVTFGSEESRYDQVPSPLGYWDEDLGNLYATEPTLLNRKESSFFGILGQMFNSASTTPSTGVEETSSGLPGVLSSIFMPTKDTQNGNIIDSALSLFNGRVSDSERLIAGLDNSPAANASFLARSLNSGSIDGINYSDFKNLDPNSRGAVERDLRALVTQGDKKLQSFAQDAINRSGS